MSDDDDDVDDDGTSEHSTSSDSYKPPLLTIEQLNEKLVEFLQVDDSLDDDSISGILMLI